MMVFCEMAENKPPLYEQQQKLKIDEAIISKIAENDMAAFEEFYCVTKRSVYAFALSILRNSDDALDVLQDTYLKIRAAAHLYKPMGKPMAWVFTIVRNLSISKLRSKERANGIQFDNMENDLSFSYITDDEDKLVLQAALTILKEQEREIILLHAISGLTHIEIAKNVGIPLSTVLSKYHRGLKKLKRYLTEQEAL
jgi:RNA polymerase sigma-70 factor (ECF subfamily)